MTDNCGNCRFWVLIDETGDCRRRAPTITMSAVYPSQNRDSRDALIAYWPNTDETEWCGDHEAAHEA